MSDTPKPCCSSAHNLQIVREQVSRLEDENRQLRLLVRDLEWFQRLVWLLAGDRIESKDVRR